VAKEQQPDLDQQARAFCEVLNAYGVTYLLLGSLAARFQGANLTTIDIDVAPAPAPDNLQHLADALNTLQPRWRLRGRPEGAKIDGRLEPRHFLGDSLAVGLVTRLGRLDIVFRIDGFEGNAYTALSPRAITLDIDDVAIRVGAVEDIITSKRAAGRQKDRDHLVILERLMTERELGTPEPKGHAGGTEPTDDEAQDPSDTT
jgi:hypothetical protein